MIPILYEKNETSFTSNGICRLHDCLSVKVTEERNGVYECDFDYPVTGAHYDEIVCGRIIAVTHDDSGDIQPFDIVGYTAPINGVVSFHAVHISYRLNYITTIDIKHFIAKDHSQSTQEQVPPAAIMTLLKTGVQNSGSWVIHPAYPACPFSFDSDITTRDLLTLDSKEPITLRQVLGGKEGGILDTFHCEFEFDRWTVHMWSNRGQQRDFAIRYGLNMTEYNDEADTSEAFNSVAPFWNGNDTLKSIQHVDSGRTLPSGRVACVPLDLSSNFENEPTTAQLTSAAQSYMNSNRTFNPAQTINVSFVRLQDSEEYEQYRLLMQCGVCDTITVKFPMYNMSARMKIVKVVYDVLQERYDSMELGELSTTLSQALGVSSGSSYSGSSGGGGGTTSYNDLTNKPQINSQTLTGNKTASDLGLVADTVTTISPTITASVGTLVSCTAFKFGKMVFMTIAVRKTSSTASGANIFVGTLSETAYRPKAIVTGASYYDAHAISAQINTSGAIVFRNASPSAVTIGSSYSVAVSFTYMID